MIQFFTDITDFVLGRNVEDYNISRSDSDFIQLQTLLNQKNESIQPFKEKLNEANAINCRFNKLILESVAEFKKDINEARTRLLSPFFYHDLDDLDSSRSFLNTNIMNRWFDYLSLTNPGVANIHSHWGLQYLDDLAKEILPLDKERLKKATIVFWPVVYGGHWYGLMIMQSDLVNIQINCFDGNNLFQNHEYILSIGKDLVAALHGIEYANRATKKKWYIPRQDNNEDCGVAISYCAQRVCNGYSLSFEIETEYCSYTDFRLTMAKNLSSLTVDQFMNGFIAQGQRRNPLSCSMTNLMPVITCNSNLKKVKVL